MLQEKVIWIAAKCIHVVHVASAQVVDADDKVAFREELVSQVEPEEACASGQQRNFARRSSGAHERKKVRLLEANAAIGV